MNQEPWETASEPVRPTAVSRCSTESQHLTGTTYRVSQGGLALLQAQAHLCDEPASLLSSVLILTAQGLSSFHSPLEVIQAVPVRVLLAPCLGQLEIKRSHGT